MCNGVSNSLQVHALEVCYENALYKFTFYITLGLHYNYITCISDRIMDQNVKFNMATATILDFVGYGFRRLKLFQNLIFSLCVKFGANSFKNVRDIAV